MSPPPIHWNSRGRPDIMLLAELRSLFDEHAKRDGDGWTVEHTQKALADKLKAKLEARGLDSSTADPPTEPTALSHHAGLTSMPDLVQRKCQPKTAAREASETSIRNLISLLCAMLNAWSYVCTDIGSVPREFCVDASKASPGCKETVE